MIQFKQVHFLFRLNKPRKIYKKNFYQGIPHFHKPNYVDIHDGYKYRPKEEVMDQVENIKVRLDTTRHIYPDNDPHHIIKNRKAIIEFNVQMFQFTHLQIQRFKLLMGPRFNEKTNHVKMVCQIFPEYNQNLQKVIEQLKQVVLQSKRAP